MKKKSEYDNFASMLGKVAKVSHDEIKAKLEAEKKAKKKKSVKDASKQTGRRS